MLPLNSNIISYQLQAHKSGYTKEHKIRPMVLNFIIQIPDDTRHNHQGTDCVLRKTFYMDCHSLKRTFYQLEIEHLGSWACFECILWLWFKYLCYHSMVLDKSGPLVLHRNRSHEAVLSPKHRKKKVWAHYRRTCYVIGFGNFCLTVYSLQSWLAFKI